MATLGNYVDIDSLGHEAYEAVLEDDATPRRGLLVTEGPDSAEIILEAFPAKGYDMRDAMDLRDLILAFNRERRITPTI